MTKQTKILLSLRAKRSNPEIDCRVAEPVPAKAGAPRNDAENGNALWFILIAIGLLGLLTVSMTRGGSSSNETGSFEQNQIAASQILSYAKSIENAVQSLLARGCSENEISFENNVVAGYINPNSPTDNSCHIFEPEGAGMTYQIPNKKWLDSAFSTNSTYGEFNFSSAEIVTNVGTSRNDLILFLNAPQFGICVQLNKQSNITNPSGDVPNETVSGEVLPGPLPSNFKGVFATSFADPIGDGPGTYLDGKKTGCMKRTDASDMHQFYHVIHAR